MDLGAREAILRGNSHDLELFGWDFGSKSMIWEPEEPFRVKIHDFGGFWITI